MLGILKSERQKLGISQSHLAQLSGLSLASIQNAEAGKSNLSISNLASLLEVLGYDLQLVKRQVEWEQLAGYGLPILPAKTSVKRKQWDTAEFSKLLVAGCKEVLNSNSSSAKKLQREKEALQAMLLAIKEHYPHFFESHLSAFQIIDDIYPNEINGKLIKLRRIAIENLAKFL